MSKELQKCKPKFILCISEAKGSMGHFTVVCLVTRPWMQARLELTYFDTDLSCSLLLSCKCQVSIRTTWFIQQKQQSLYQNKVTSSLAVIQRPGHWTDTVRSSIDAMMFWPRSPGWLKLGDRRRGGDGEMPVASRSAATLLDGSVICIIFAEMLQQF